MLCSVHPNVHYLPWFFGESDNPFSLEPSYKACSTASAWGSGSCRLCRAISTGTSRESKLPSSRTRISSWNQKTHSKIKFEKKNAWMPALLWFFSPHLQPLHPKKTAEHTAHQVKSTVLWENEHANISRTPQWDSSYKTWDPRILSEKSKTHTHTQKSKNGTKFVCDCRKSFLTWQFFQKNKTKHLNSNIQKGRSSSKRFQKKLGLQGFKSNFCRFFR